MPTVSARVRDQGHDFFSTVQTSGGNTSTGFGATIGAYGHGWDSKVGVPSAPLIYLGQFELEVPEGVTITGVRWEATRYARTGATVFYRTGLIARDGTWDVSGFNFANYPNFNDPFPSPVRRPISVFTTADAYWHGGASGYATGSHATATSGRYTLGEGGSPTFTAAGLIAIFQSFLDATTGAHRAASVSGTAVPFLFCIVADAPAQGAANIQRTRNEAWATEAQRPILYIDYEDPNTDPTISIEKPATGSFHIGGSLISFEADAQDAEDGDLSASVQWSSDLDGAMGSGSPLVKSDLSEGAHTITAQVTDAGAATAQDQITVEIGASASPVVVVDPPSPPSPGLAGTAAVSYERDWIPSVESRSDARATVSARRDVRFVGDGVDE